VAHLGVAHLSVPHCLEVPETGFIRGFGILIIVNYFLQKVKIFCHNVK